jgi:hypothetical protein
MATADTEKKEPERIYIGGLDPPRLTAQHVLDRFQSMTSQSNTVEIQNVESKSDKPYFHVTAVSTSAVAPAAGDGDDEKPPSSSPTALQVLTSTFNNVKWKGCRLSVQAAQPHFLERLEQEHQERRKEKEDQAKAEKEAEMKEASSSSSSPSVPPPAAEGEVEAGMGEEETPPVVIKSKIPRRLRIRRKFGDAAYHVDQKPWCVEGWSTFTFAMGKQRKRVERHQQEKKEASKLMGRNMIMPVPLMHRAIHIRFDEGGDYGHHVDDDSNEEHSPILAETSDDDDDDADVSSSEESQSASEGKHDPYLGDNKDEALANNQSYAWSDEEDNDEAPVEEMSKDSNSVVSEESEPKLLPDATDPSKENDEDEMESDAGSRSQNLTEERLEASAPNENASKSAVQDAPPPAENTAYQWSSDEDSSDTDNDDTESKYHNRPLVPVTQSDEFAAGLDLNEDEDSENHAEEDKDYEAFYLAKPTSFKNGDLSNDVTGNLNILSSLFPEVADAQPAVVKLSSNPDIEEVKDNAKQTQTGFGASGIMLRYDPNDASTQQFEIAAENPEDNPQIAAQGDSNKEPPASSSDESLEEAENATKDEPKKEDSKEDYSQDQPVLVYEQKKLEDVFKQARDSWRGGQPAEKDSSPTAGNSSGGAFSFGFDLGVPEPPKAKESQAPGGFSFGFALPQDSGPGSSKTDDNGAEGQNLEPSSSEILAPSFKVPEKRIRGFLFPVDAIEKYKSSFFSANNGNEIIKDLEAFRNDFEVKEAWKKERNALTLDWKRKRKHAQSRIQKKMKIR